MAELMSTFDQLEYEHDGAPNRSRAREIRDAQDRIVEELDTLQDHINTVLSGAKVSETRLMQPTESDSRHLVSEQSDDVPEGHEDTEGDDEPLEEEQERAEHDEEPEGDTEEPEGDIEKPEGDIEKPEEDVEAPEEEPGEEPEEDDEEPDEDEDPGDHDESPLPPVPRSTASGDVSAAQLVEGIEVALQRPDAAVALLWPAVRFLERAAVPQVDMLPPSETIEAAFVLEQYQADGVPAHRERLEQLIGAVDARTNNTSQQAAAVVLTGGAAVLIAGTDSVGWASGAVLSADPSSPTAIVAWYREISDLQRRLANLGVTGSPLTLVSWQDGPRRQVAVCAQLETLFHQLRHHFFPFQVGNRFLRAAFPAHGSGRLDFLLDQARAPRPDLERLRNWHEEFDARVFMADVLRQVRGPRNEDASIHAWAERYILDRLDAIHGTVGELLGLNDKRVGTQVEPIAEQLRLLKASTRDWLRDLSVPGDSKWQAIRGWATRVLTNVQHRLEGV